MRHDIAKLMAALYFEEPAAKAVLLQIGFPAHLIPKFESANAFWTTAVMQLEQGIGLQDGLANLVAETAATYAGNNEVQALHDELSGKVPQRKVRKATDPEAPCPTLMLIGADLPNQFLQTAREQLGNARVELLYVSKQQCALAVPDLGDNAVRVQQQIQELMQTYAPDAKLQVSYEKYQFRPYLYSDLTVFGPDTTPYLLQAVPATMTPGDIAAAIVQQNHDAMTDRRGRTVSTVVDAESDNGSSRLDPEKTLHENKVKDKGRLRVGTKAVAGNISPELRMEAQLRMRAQIRRYAYGNPDFEIAGYDNEDLPNRLTFELEGPGLAPPTGLDTFLAGTENLTIEDFRALPWHELDPVPIDFHRFTIHLPAMFPVVAPYVVWDTPVFHPNIWRLPQPGVRPGTVCLGPLMYGYRPDLDFAFLCQLLVDIGTYRNYDVVEAPTFPDPPAALWARTDAGQQVIIGLGGPPMRETGESEQARTAPPLHLRMLTDQ